MRLNVVCFSGKVFRVGDPRTVGESTVCEIRLRQSYPKGRKTEGQKLERDDFHTDWATAVCWGMTAEVAQQLQEDDIVIVEGRWHHEEWVDKKTGDKRQRDVIKAAYIHKVSQGQAVHSTSEAVEDEMPF